MLTQKYVESHAEIRYFTQTSFDIKTLPAYSHFTINNVQNTANQI